MTSFRPALFASAAAMMLSAGALAQTTTPTAPAAPAQTAPAAPAQTAPATRAQTNATTQTTLAANEVTSTSIVGAAIYAPKAGGSAANRAADPATTASTAPRTGTNAATPANSNAAATASNMGFPSMGDAEWNAMKGNHDHIGEVNNLVVGTDGRIHQVVLGVGGFLGIGEKNVAVPLDKITVAEVPNSDDMKLTTQETADSLKAAPEFKTKSAQMAEQNATTPVDGSTTSSTAPAGTMAPADGAAPAGGAAPATTNN